MPSFSWGHSFHIGTVLLAWILVVLCSWAVEFDQQQKTNHTAPRRLNTKECCRLKEGGRGGGGRWNGGIQGNVFGWQNHSTEKKKSKKLGGDSKKEWNYGLNEWKKEEKIEEGECTMWGLGKRAVTGGDNHPNLKENPQWLEGEEKNAACHSDFFSPFSIVYFLLFFSLIVLRLR